LVRAILWSSCPFKSQLLTLSVVKLGGVSLEPLITATLVTLLLATLAAAIPLEDKVCIEYCPYPKYPWMPFWRVAVVMFFSWLIAASFASRERMVLTWFTLMSMVAMAIAHYFQLALIVFTRNVEVALYPLFYTIKTTGGQTLHLDLAQVVIVVTAVELYFILRKAPRTASSEGRTP